MKFILITHTSLKDLCSVQYFSGQSSAIDAKLLKSGYVVPMVKSSLKKYYVHHELVDRYEIPISQMIVDLFPLK